MREIIQWYSLSQIIGWISFPLVYKIFRNLPDKGYSLSKSFGFLLCGYTFWLGNIFGLINNTQLGALSCLLFIIIASIICGIKIKSIKQWSKRNIEIILLQEILLIFSLSMLILLRVANPNVSGTEKPMELAFINAIIKSSKFPPNDPWLSGYAISYYYFGYVIVAMIAKIFNTTGSVAFNLGISFSFALTSVSVYGLVYNLIILREKWKRAINFKKIQKILLLCLLAPIILLIVSNAEGLLEIMHAKGLLWQKNSNGIYNSTFWEYLDIKELINPPLSQSSWRPTRTGGIWWWRASRVITDYDLAGDQKEIINEFPFFSFYLSDLHPHVLAMPYVLMAISLSLNLFFASKEYFSINPPFRANQIIHFISDSLILGCLLFINTWDFPIYFGLFSLTLLLKQYLVERKWKSVINSLLYLTLIFLIVIILFFPFLLGFSSQAGGILPSLNYFTRGVHFWIMFFPIIIPIFIYLAYLNKPGLTKYILRGLLVSLLVIFILFVLSYLFSLCLAKISGKEFLNIHGGLPIEILIKESLFNRIKSPITVVSLLLLLGLCFAYLYRTLFTSTDSSKKEQLKYKNDEMKIISNYFIVILILVGVLLILIPEFFYLRDVFNTRMNTIFKFYFQAWIIFSIVSSFSIIFFLLTSHKNKIMKWANIFLLLMPLIIGMIYPFFTISERIKGNILNQATLDGFLYYSKINKDEYDAISFMKKLSYGYIIEAVGGSYSGYARISMATGLPTILGWPGHEVQWRGGVGEIGSRDSDVSIIYSSSDWEYTKSLLDLYKIRYIYIGDLERGKYSIAEDKFQKNMIPIYKNDTVNIYEYSD